MFLVSLRSGVTVLENRFGRRPPEYKLELEFQSGRTNLLVDQFVRSTRIEEKRWNSVLSGRPLLLVERWMFALLVSILSYADNTYGGRTGSDGDDDPKQRVKEYIASAESELSAITLLARRMARRHIVQWYLGGLPLGVGVVIGIGLTITNYRYRVGDTVENWSIMYSLCAGAVGAVISVMVRVSHGENLEIDIYSGRKITLFVGAFRPIIGAIFGVVFFVFVHAGIVPFAPPGGKNVTLFFADYLF